MGAANKAGMIPGVGDAIKLFGNYKGMTAGIKTANEQRASDITHTNVFKNAGKESQKMLDNAKQGIETSKAQAIVKATDVGRGGKRGARNSARGVNQMRGMDWLYDTALQSQIAEISANAAQQLSGIDVQKSGVAMNADQMRGKGEYDAAMANEAAKDAYYTALGKGRGQFAEGMQQSGKDLNAMKQNKIMENLMKDYGKWFKADATGKLSNKNPTV
jgi:archaellin